MTSLGRVRVVGSDGKTRWIHRNDAASWDVNVTRSAPACNAVKDMCESCCQRRAVHGGTGLSRLRRHMQQPNAHVRIAVVGNSVARFNDFGVARGLIAELMKRFPKLRVSVEYANVAGGFEPDHLYYCGLTSKSLLDADLILVHYHAPRGGMVYEKILRRLLQLPREPTIVYVAHCTMADFSAYRDWALMRDRGPRGLRSETEGQGYMEEVRRIEERLLKAYGISFVSTCTAFRTMLGSVDQSSQARLLDGSWGDSWQNWRVRMARRWLPQDVAYGVDPPRTDSLGTWNTSALLCPPRRGLHKGGDGRHAPHQHHQQSQSTHHHRVHHTPSFSHVTDLAPRFFLPADHLHFGPLGSALQACLVSHLVLDSPVAHRRQRSSTSHVLTRHEARMLCGTGGGQGKHCHDSSKDEPIFCSNVKEGGLVPAPDSHGWTAIHNAGAGASKSWLHSRTVGATLNVKMAQPASAFMLEVYRHHDLGLGRIQVWLPDMATPVTIDSCCPHPGCSGVPVGKGRYMSTRVPHSGYLSRPTTNITIKVIGRSPYEKSSCARKGSDVSLAAVVGLRGWVHGS